MAIYTKCWEDQLVQHTECAVKTNWWHYQLPPCRIFVFDKVTWIHLNRFLSIAIFKFIGIHVTSAMIVSHEERHQTWYSALLPSRDLVLSMVSSSWCVIICKLKFCNPSKRICIWSAVCARLTSPCFLCVCFSHQNIVPFP